MVDKRTSIGLDMALLPIESSEKQAGRAADRYQEKLDDEHGHCPQPRPFTAQGEQHRLWRNSNKRTVTFVAAGACALITLAAAGFSWLLVHGMCQTLRNMHAKLIGISVGELRAIWRDGSRRAEP